MSRAAVSVLAGLLVTSACTDPPSLSWRDEAAMLEPEPLDLSSYWLYDVGVFDVNDDGLLDLYTTAHMARASVMINEGSRFAEALDSLGLNADPGLPWMEPMDTAPRLEAPGVYVWMHQTSLYFAAHRLGPDVQPVVSLQFDFPANLDADPVAVVDAQGATVEVEETPQSDGDRLMTIRAAFRDGATAQLEPFLTALQYTVTLGRGLTPERLRLGFEGRPAPSTTFTLRFRDRHGWAWSRTGENGTRVYVGNGGLKNTLHLYASHDWVTDELFVVGAPSTQNRYQAARLYKGDCRTYRTMLLDADGDGRTDLSRSCVGGGHELLSGRPNGRFARPRAVSKPTGAGDQFQWFDADRDGDLDLLYEAEHQLWLGRRRTGGFDRTRIAEVGDVERLALGDYDADLDIDVLAFVTDGPTQVLRNHAGSLELIPAETLGLPRDAITGGWVDADLDGRLDYHDVPNGLFLAQVDGTFAATGLLTGAGEATPEPLAARLAWFDAEGNGRWDVAIATQALMPARMQAARRKAKPKGISHGHWWEVLYRDLPRRSNWLGVELRDSATDRDGAGASVYLRTAAAGTQHKIAGQQDFSHYSHGHLRLLFGLGDDPSPKPRVTILWPDGNCQRTVDVNAGAWNRVEYATGRCD